MVRSRQLIFNALSSWKWPDIPGIETFKGVLLHSANYDTMAKLDDKAVVVIGTGSSGIRIVPQVQRGKQDLPVRE